MNQLTLPSPKRKNLIKPTVSKERNNTRNLFSTV